MRRRLVFRPEVFQEEIITSSYKRVTNWNWDYHWSCVQASPHSELFAPLATLVTLTGTLCILLLPMADFEKLTLGTFINCVFLPDRTLTLHPVRRAVDTITATRLQGIELHLQSCI